MIDNCLLQRLPLLRLLRVSRRSRDEAELYAMFLLWMLSELFKELPEIGDPDKPKLVFTCSPSIPGTQPVSSARLEAECARLKAELKKR
jgi:Helicase HerA-like C-terminal